MVSLHTLQSLLITNRRIISIFNNYLFQIFIVNKDILAYKVHELLSSKNITLAVAESATGGLITHRLTNFPGSSKYLHLGITVYSDQSKIKIVNINPAIITEKGSVSSEVASELSKGIRDVLGSNIGLSITGIAGPTGSTDSDPVGTAYISLDTNDLHKVIKIHNDGNRSENKEFFSDKAFQFLLETIK